MQLSACSVSVAVTAPSTYHKYDSHLYPVIGLLFGITDYRDIVV